MRLQNASQLRDESPDAFLDCLRKLCQRTVTQSGNPVEQAVLNREAEKIKKKNLAGAGENRSQSPSTEPQERIWFLPVENPDGIKFDTKMINEDK
jgi:hypothetical protein